MVLKFSVLNNYFGFHGLLGNKNVLDEAVK